jgi:S1-C subfamily serine protease
MSTRFIPILLGILFLHSFSVVTANDEPLPRRAVLGLAFAPVPPSYAKTHKLDEGVGILATEVVPEKTAASAGILKDDIIIALDGKPLLFKDTPSRVRELVAERVLPSASFARLRSWN